MNLNESFCWFAISMDEPEVRRVGFASFAILPPSRAIAPLLLWRRGSSGSGGGLCAMLEMPKFVPMARPYASDTPISLSIYNSRLRKLCTKPPSQAREPGQIGPMNGQDEYAPDRGVGGFPEFDPFSNTCANCWVLRSSVSRPVAARFGGLLGVNLEVVELSWRSLGSILEEYWESY